MVNEKSIPNDKDMQDDEYAFKIASLNRITTKPDFFLVSDAQKTALTALAKKHNYSVVIMSPQDFDIPGY